MALGLVLVIAFLVTFDLEAAIIVVVFLELFSLAVFVLSTVISLAFSFSFVTVETLVVLELLVLIVSTVVILELRLDSVAIDSGIFSVDSSIVVSLDFSVDAEGALRTLRFAFILGAKPFLFLSMRIIGKYFTSFFFFTIYINITDSKSCK